MMGILPLTSARVFFHCLGFQGSICIGVVNKKSFSISDNLSTGDMVFASFLH